MYVRLPGPYAASIRSARRIAASRIFRSPVAACQAAAASRKWPDTRTDCSGSRLRASRLASSASMRPSTYAFRRASGCLVSMYAAASISFETLNALSSNRWKQWSSDTRRFASMRGRQNVSVMSTCSSGTARRP